MRLYHQTTRAAADAILRDGFRDGVGYYLASEEFSGVWLANELLDENEGAFGDVVLLVDVPIGLVRDYEWIEEGRFLREWLVPATVLNGHARIREAPANQEQVTGEHRHKKIMKLLAALGTEEG